MCSKKASQFISFLPWVNKGKPHRLAPLAWFPYPKQQEQNQLAYKFWLMDLFLLDTSFCSKSLMGWADFGWWHPRDQSSAASELIQSFIQQYLWGSFYVEQVGREEKFLRRIEFPCPFFVWTFKYLVLNLYFSRLNSLFISFWLCWVFFAQRTLSSSGDQGYFLVVELSLWWLLLLRNTQSRMCGLP